MLALAKHLYEGGEVSSRWMRDTLSISHATAKRYMVKLERCLPVTTEDKPVGPKGRERMGRVLRLMKTPNTEVTGLSAAWRERSASNDEFGVCY